ncbi:TetR/AcrR family transcriptional regulator [Aliiroseovarius crassostreae]|uniref:TetR/AcrR family transcriptional regulator n=1 Tax=Aliiroseovarius crassostreae TaxID=154981 RepID=UPI003C7C64D8
MSTPQPRTLKTRARLIQAARDVIAETGYSALRTENVAQRAGVAKGTFFAHFKDKDALMDLLIGERIDGFLDQIEAAPAPRTIPELVEAMMPMMRFMSHERYVFDVILRYSGAAAKEEIGPIAMTFERFVTVMERWLVQGGFRNDVSPNLLAEGVQAFMFQALALRFCARNNTTPLDESLRPYLEVWLTAPQDVR